MLYEKIIKTILANRGINTEEEITKFLNPSTNDFLNPFDLFGMHEACERINQSIINKETVLIYGDYDADGICAVSSLYLFLKNKGVNVISFIPNRHTDGYGLSEETIEQIASEFFPDLVITVDTGISAEKEIEMLMDAGIDCIVTDHHEPPTSANLPKCIVVDPKISGQKYGFNGLSGAGVVFKLIQALDSLEEALKYVDIVAISTVGDIVPLISENRIITILGLQKMNDKNARPSISYLKKALDLKQITSSDISFKIVPRLNASGRMDSAYKCFEFMIETDSNKLKELYSQIEEDNNERLRQSAEIQVIVDKYLKETNFNDEPAIFVKDKTINLGLIGIVASKLCGTYNRPVFVFSEDESGNYKASIRSIEGINIFEILDNYRDILIDVGGHSLAGGLTISPDKYDEFKERVVKDILKLNITSVETINDSYDAEIEEKDINMNLVNELLKLEPFGFANSKPQFLLKLTKSNFQPMKSFRHFKIITPTKKEIITFFGAKYKTIFNNNAEKKLIVTIEQDTFSRTPKPKVMFKSMTCEMDESSKDYTKLIRLYNHFSSINSSNESKIKQIKDEEEIQGVLNNKFGTIIWTDNYKRASELSNKYGYKIQAYLEPDAKSIVLYNTAQIVDFNNVAYKDLVIDFNQTYTKEFNFIKNFNIYIKETTNEPIKVNLSREIFAGYYKQIIGKLPLSANDFIEAVEIVSGGKDVEMFGICLLVCMELGFVNYEQNEVFSLSHKANKTKKQLTESTIYNLVNN